MTTEQTKIATEKSIPAVPGRRIDITALITLNPKYGMKMIPQLHCRSASDALGPVS